MPKKKQKKVKFRKIDGIDILELDRDTHRMMKYDPLYYSKPRVIDKEEKNKDVKT